MTSVKGGLFVWGVIIVLMAFEDFPTHTEELPVTDSMFFEDGSLNEIHLAANYGLSSSEAMQQVEFGSYSGTVAQMLSDDKCPVGAMVRGAYKEKGLEGVEEKLTMLAAMDSRVAITITPETRQRAESVKKN